MVDKFGVGCGPLPQKILNSNFTQNIHFAISRFSLKNPIQLIGEVDFYSLQYFNQCIVISDRSAT